MSDKPISREDLEAEANARIATKRQQDWTDNQINSLCEQCIGELDERIEQLRERLIHLQEVRATWERTRDMLAREGR
jgi:hypothetical protein